MFRLFKIKENKKTRISEAYQKMRVAIDNRLHIWAGYLNKKAARVTRFTVQLYLVIFCTSFASVFIYVGIQAINNPVQKRVIDPIHFPAYVLPAPTPSKQMPLMILSEREYGDIQLFKKHMDSLLHSKGGKVIYDSVMMERPGLMDSIAIVEKIYEQQIKFK